MVNVENNDPKFRIDVEDEGLFLAYCASKRTPEEKQKDAERATAAEVQLKTQIARMEECRKRNAEQ